MTPRQLAAAAALAAGLATINTAGAEDIFFTTPALYTFNQTDNNPGNGFPFAFAEPGTVSRLDSQTGNIAVFEENVASGAVGLAADHNGTIYATVVTSDTFTEPLSVELMRLTGDGPIPLATITEPGFGVGGVGSNGLDLACGPDNHLYYITPQRFNANGTSGATIGRYDAATGTTETVASGFTDGLAGLAFGPDGHLYAGSILRSDDQPAPSLSIELVRLNTDSLEVEPVATLIDGTDVVIGNNGFDFDIAINPVGEVFFNQPEVFELETLVLFDDPACGNACIIAFPGDIISVAGVSKYDPATGAISTIAQTTSPGTAGVAIAENGNILYGDSGAFGTVTIRSVPADGGTPITLGTAYEPEGQNQFLQEHHFELTTGAHAVGGPVRIPDELAADLNDDGTVTILDLLIFLDSYFDNTADLNGDDQTTILDLLIYLERFLGA